MKTYLEDRKSYNVEFAIELPGPWSTEINELEDFFKGQKLPGRLQLDSITTIIDMRIFLKVHISICKGQNGNERYLPYLDRLKAAREILSKDPKNNNDVNTVQKMLSICSGTTA